MLFVSESTSGWCLVCLKIDFLVLPLPRHCVQTRNERATGDFLKPVFVLRTRMGGFSCWGHFCVEFLTALQDWREN